MLIYFKLISFFFKIQLIQKTIISFNLCKFLIILWDYVENYLHLVLCFEFLCISSFVHSFSIIEKEQKSELSHRNLEHGSRKYVEGFCDREIDLKLSYGFFSRDLSHAVIYKLCHIAEIHFETSEYRRSEY